MAAALLLAATAAVTAAQSGDDWVRVRGGDIPADAVGAGAETGGKSFVCRAVYRGEYIAGKAVGGRCYYNTGGRERSSARFEVLVGREYVWRRTSDLRRAVAVGGSSTENYYICRVRDSGGEYPGRTERGRCYYTRDGRARSSGSYEVLIGGRDNLNLLGAAERGDLQALRDALREGQAVDQTDPDGRTALMLASEKGHERIVRELLYERATVDLRDDRGNTALLLASGAGRTDVVRLLLRDGADIGLRNRDGDTAFVLAAAGGHERLVGEFLRFELSGRIDRSDLENGFWKAAANGHTGVLGLLLTNGVDVNARNIEGVTALMRAAAAGRTRAVAFLIGNGAATDLRDVRGRTAFLHGIEADSDDVLLVFMGGEVPLIRADSREAAEGLLLAAGTDRRKALRYLLRRGVDRDAVTLSEGSTALMLAAVEGHGDTTEILLEAGADPNRRNRNGETALILAAANSKNNTTKLLIRAGADLNIRDNRGLTALGWAIRNKHKDTRNTLRKAGAKQ